MITGLIKGARPSSLVGGLLGLIIVAAFMVPAEAGASDPEFVFDGDNTPRGSFEGPCGVAVDSGGRFYVSAYYHDAVSVFNPVTSFLTSRTGIDPLSGPCGLAVAPGGTLYVNSFHRAVHSFTPSSWPPSSGTTYDPALEIGSSNLTGVAFDPGASHIYVNARTHIAVYDTDGQPVEVGGSELRIGEGSLIDAYGLAFSEHPGTAGRVYVADAGDQTLKVYDPSIDVDHPVQEIDGAETARGEFTSLRDAEVAVDRVSGEIYLVDNLQPAFTWRPQAVVHVFFSNGDYHGRLKLNVIHGEPSGLAVDNSSGSTQGRVYVTSGNAEAGVVYAYPPGSAVDETGSALQGLTLSSSGSGSGAVLVEPAGIECREGCEVELLTGSTANLTAVPDSGSEVSGWSGSECEGDTCLVDMSAPASVAVDFEAEEGGGKSETGGASSSPDAEPVEAISASNRLRPKSRLAGSGLRVPKRAVARRGNVEVSVSSGLSPRLLPRRAFAPVAVSIGGRVSTRDGSEPPQLNRMLIEMNRHGRMDIRGLPICRPDDIQPATTRRALAACRGALVGQGRFEANVALPEQEAYPTQGRLLVFNGRLGGRPVLLGHIYSAQPFNNSFLIVFSIRRINRGPYGTALVASLPRALGNWGHLTAIEMRLARMFRDRGQRRSYLSARCAAPRGVNRAAFELARITYTFQGGMRLRTSSVESCRVRR